MNLNDLLSKMILIAALVLGFFLLSGDFEEIEKRPFGVDISSFRFLGVDNPTRHRQYCGDFPCYSPQEFIDIYNRFEQERGLPFLAKYIYNNVEADEHLRILAEKRGYQRRSFADESELVSLESHRTQQEVRNAYIAMRDDMANYGIRLHFVSGYRSSTDQRGIFTDKLGLIDLHDIAEGAYDEDIDTVMTVSALPAYSKHHSGYAVDFACGNDYLVYEFAETSCYLWMSQNNFENTKRYGFIPSYPYGVDKQGPNPEPWEFVWVGSDYLK